VLGNGPIAVSAFGKDIIHAGAEAGTITINTASTQIWVDRVALQVNNGDTTGGNAQTIPVSEPICY
jgi:hypothetical protein